MASSLDHIEQTLADAYRKEIDQEENVWRSLPFFAATVALELAAVFQIAGHLPPVGAGAWWVSIGCVAVAGLATWTALRFLAASIYPAKFSYIAPGPDLLTYASQLAEAEAQSIASKDAVPIDALAQLKATLAHQYAEASYYNRRINRRRGLWRSIAGMATLLGVSTMIAMVVTVTTYYVWHA
jgi:hypothetical protein